MVVLLDLADLFSPLEFLLSILVPFTLQIRATWMASPTKFGSVSV